VIILVPAVLFAGLAIYYAVLIVKDSRERRLDREARERRDRQIGASIAALKSEPLEDAGDAVAVLTSLRELNGSGGRNR
jgi:hypothetical protein